MWFYQSHCHPKLTHFCLKVVLCSLDSGLPPRPKTCKSNLCHQQFVSEIGDSSTMMRHWRWNVPITIMRLHCYFTYKSETLQLGHTFLRYEAWHHVGVTHWIPLHGELHVSTKINCELLPKIVLRVAVIFLFRFKPISLAVCLHSSELLEDNNGTERLFFRFRFFFGRSYVTLAMIRVLQLSNAKNTFCQYDFHK